MRSKLTALIISAIIVTACTPAQVAEVLRKQGVDPTPAVVGAIVHAENDRGASFLQQAKSLHDTPVLACIRHHESDTAGGYVAYNPDGPYYGAYQYLQGTWNWAASHYGAPQYAGVDPRQVPGYFQDLVTLNYHNAVGDGPWGNRC